MAAEIDLWQVLFSSRSFAVIGVSLVLLSGSLLCHRLLESTAAGACWYEKLFAWLFLCYFCSLRGLFLSFVLCLLQQFFLVAKPGVSKWGGGVKGRVREGVYPSRWGPGGCAPGKIFKLQMHAGEF
jgi:hypothetical protein